MLSRRRPPLTFAVKTSKTVYRNVQTAVTPWRKHAYLSRLPLPKPLEKIRLEPGNIVHPTGPVMSGVKGEEHIHPVDLDYKHVVPEDERIGLVLTGIYPATNVKTIAEYMKKQNVHLRHCWVHSEGVCCIRFQDERDMEIMKKQLSELKNYPFRVYDVNSRHWYGKPPDLQSPIQVLPLTTNYSQEAPEPGKVLVLRTILGLSQTTMAPFRQYGRPDTPVRFVYTKFYAHDRWIWEYYLEFPTFDDADLALKNHAGEKITIPYGSLSTVEKLRFPYGKTLHLWLRHTGLDTLPRMHVKSTVLYDTMYREPRSGGKSHQERQRLENVHHGGSGEG